MPAAHDNTIYETGDFSLQFKFFVCIFLMGKLDGMQSK